MSSAWLCLGSMESSPFLGIFCRSPSDIGQCLPRPVNPFNAACYGNFYLQGERGVQALRRESGSYIQETAEFARSEEAAPVMSVF